MWHLAALSCSAHARASWSLRLPLEIRTRLPARCPDGAVAIYTSRTYVVHGTTYAAIRTRFSRICLRDRSLVSRTRALATVYHRSIFILCANSLRQRAATWSSCSSGCCNRTLSKVRVLVIHLSRSRHRIPIETWSVNMCRTYRYSVKATMLLEPCNFFVRFFSLVKNDISLFYVMHFVCVLTNNFLLNYVNFGNKFK